MQRWHQRRGARERASAGGDGPADVAESEPQPGHRTSVLAGAAAGPGGIAPATGGRYNPAPVEGPGRRPEGGRGEPGGFRGSAGATAGDTPGLIADGRGRFLELFSTTEVREAEAMMEDGVPHAAIRLALLGGEPMPRASAVAGEPPPRAEAADPAERAPQPQPEPEPRGGQGAPLELGYLVLRAPPPNAHLRGHHRCSWGELMARLGIQRELWPSNRAGYHLRCFTDAGEADRHWAAQRLARPIPVDPP